MYGQGLISVLYFETYKGTWKVMSYIYVAQTSFISIPQSLEGKGVREGYEFIRIYSYT